MSDAQTEPTNTSFEIIVSGHLCLDLIPDMRHVPPGGLNEPGRLFEVGPLVFSTGGPVSNTGLALHRLGVRVGLMSVVGDDLIGQVVISSLRRRDPQLAALIHTQAGVNTSYSVVLAPGGADRTFLHCTGQNAVFNSTHIDYAALRSAQIFHLGYPPLLPSLIADGGAELEAIYRQAKLSGVVTSMDMVVPDPDGPSGRVDWLPILRRVLPHVDVFLPSLEEILYMLRRDDLNRWGHRAVDEIDAPYLHRLTGELLDMGAVIAGVKLGAKGMYLRTAGGAALNRLARLDLDVAAWQDVTLWHPAFDVQVAGTLGAGDAALAGFLVGLLHCKPPAEALRFGCAVGACCVEVPDSTSGIQSMAETQQRLTAGWPVRPEKLAGW